MGFKIYPRPSPKRRGEIRDSSALWERGDKRLPLPFGRGEIRDSLALWERGDKRLPRPLGEGGGEGG